MEFSDEALEVIRQYEERFSEEVPFGLMLEPIEELCVPILRQCLEEGTLDPIDRQFPAGARI